MLLIEKLGRRKVEILNLTQHNGSPEQAKEGLVEPSEEDRRAIVSLISFEDIPSSEEMEERAERLAKIVLNYGCTTAMIGGAPYFMAPLERALLTNGIPPLYAFSRRESVDEVQPDGSVRKVAVFRHAGWVAPCGLPRQ